MKLTLVHSVLGLSSLAVAIPTDLLDRGNYDQCIGINKWEAKQFLDRNTKLWNRDGDWKDLARSLYAKDFKGTSNSIRSSRGQKISDQPFYNSRSDFIYDLEKYIPKIYDQSTVNYYIDCNTLIWVRNIGRVNGSKDPVRDISIFTMQRGKGNKLQVKSAQIEFDSKSWGQAFGVTCTGPTSRNGYGHDDYSYGNKKNNDKQTSPQHNDNGYDDGKKSDPKHNDGKNNGGYQVDPKSNDSHGKDNKDHNNNGYKNNGFKDGGKNLDPQQGSGYDREKKDNGHQADPKTGDGYGKKNDGSKDGGKQVDPQQGSGYDKDKKDAGHQVDPKTGDGYDKKDGGHSTDPKGQDGYGKKDDGHKTSPSTSDGYDKKDDKPEDPQISNSYGQKDDGKKSDPTQLPGYGTNDKDSKGQQSDPTKHDDKKDGTQVDSHSQNNENKNGQYDNGVKGY